MRLKQEDIMKNKMCSICGKQNEKLYTVDDIPELMLVFYQGKYEPHYYCKICVNKIRKDLYNDNNR